jgi:hypothetical protein
VILAAMVWRTVKQSAARPPTHAEIPPA